MIANLKNLVSDKLGCTDLIEHDIELLSQESFRGRPFLLSPYMLEHLKSEVRLMLRLVIRPSSSP